MSSSAARFELWVDGGGRPLLERLRGHHAVSGTVRFSAYDQPVSVRAPARSESAG